MQPDHSGDMSLANAPTAHIPRSRQGARAAMRVTNRYTMPALVPRAQQHSDFFWHGQDQGQRMATVPDPHREPLFPAKEDAWLNDVLPPSRPDRLLTGTTMRTSPDASNPILPGHHLWLVVHRLSEHVCRELERRRAGAGGHDSGVEELERECAVDMLRAEPTLACQIYNLTEAEQVIQAVIDEVSGFGPLAALWREDAVTEIMAIGPRLTMIERDGDMQEAPYHFEDEQHMMRIVGNMLRGTEHPCDPPAMITDARLPDGTLVHVVMPPGAVKGPTITMHKRRTHMPALEELVTLDMVSEPMARFLRMCVETRLNIVICGGPRSGRTTLLNALALCIPAGERIVTLEDMAELQLTQKQVVALEARLTSYGRERETSESMRELLLCALRLRPQRVIMGDCWNDDAGILLSALHTGYDGSLFTMYANGLQDCLGRLEMTWLANRSATSRSVTREQVARTVHLVIYLARLSNGSRKVMNIAEVMGVQGDRIKARSIFHYQENSEGQGSFEPGNFEPTCLAELQHKQRAADIVMGTFRDKKSPR